MRTPKNAPIELTRQDTEEAEGEFTAENEDIENSIPEDIDLNLPEQVQQLIQKLKTVTEKASSQHSRETHSYEMAHMKNAMVPIFMDKKNSLLEELSEKPSIEFVIAGFRVTITKA